MDSADYLGNLGLGSEVQPADQAFLTWLSGLRVDAQTLRCFAAGWVNESDAMLGTSNLMVSNAIMQQAKQEPRWLEHGFLLIGSCCNGDPIAIDLRGRPGAVCYLCHEVLWSDEEADPRKFAAMVAQDLAAFVAAAWDIDDFPADFNEASERNG